MHFSTLTLILCLCKWGISSLLHSPRCEKTTWRDVSQRLLHSTSVVKNRSSCSNYRVGGLRLSVQTLCAHVCMCLNMANMCVCECLLNQNLQSWIYSGTFPGALRARNQKFPLIVVYSYAWIYTTSFARKYRASLLTKKKQKKKTFQHSAWCATRGEKKLPCVLCSHLLVSHTLKASGASG